MIDWNTATNLLKSLDQTILWLTWLTGAVKTWRGTSSLEGQKKRIIPVCNTGAYGANAACQKQIKCLHLAASQPVFWGLFRGVSANQDSQPLRCQLWPEAIGLCTRPMVYTWWTHYKIKEGQKLFYVDNDLPKVQKPNPSIQTVSVPNWCPSLCSLFWWKKNQMYECRSCL